MTTSQELLTNNQPIVITLASLGNNSMQASAQISNQSPSYFDAGVMVEVTTSSAPSSTGTIGVYAYGSANGGSVNTDGVVQSSVSGSFSPSSPTNLKLLGIVNANVGSTTYVGGPFSPAAAFGYLPGYWGIVVQNTTGAALASTSSNNIAFYEGQEIQSA